MADVHVHTYTNIYIYIYMYVFIIRKILGAIHFRCGYLSADHSVVFSLYIILPCGVTYCKK